MQKGLLSGYFRSKFWCEVFYYDGRGRALSVNHSNNFSCSSDYGFILIARISVSSRVYPPAPIPQQFATRL